MGKGEEVMVYKLGDDNEMMERDMAGHIAHSLVMTVDWPWSDRQKRMWYIGVLADTDQYFMDELKNMTIEELQVQYKVQYVKKTN